MHAAAVAVVLAKRLFQIAAAGSHGNVSETQPPTRSQFGRWFQNRDLSLLIMEAHGSAHCWARYLVRPGIEVKLPPAKYVRAQRLNSPARAAFRPGPVK